MPATSVGATDDTFDESGAIDLRIWRQPGIAMAEGMPGRFKLCLAQRVYSGLQFVSCTAIREPMKAQPGRPKSHSPVGNADLLQLAYESGSCPGLIGHLD